jgi:hypothetical protein
MSMLEITRTNLGNSLVSNYELDYDLHLFVASHDPASEEARANLNKICKTYISGHYNLQITDIHNNFDAVIKNGVLVTPTLKVIITPIGQPAIKPITIIGTLTNTQRVLTALLIDG